MADDKQMTKNILLPSEETKSNENEVVVGTGNYFGHTLSKEEIIGSADNDLQESWAYQKQKLSTQQADAIRSFNGAPYKTPVDDNNNEIPNEANKYSSYRSRLLRQATNAMRAYVKNTLLAPGVSPIALMSAGNFMEDEAKHATQYMWAKWGNPYKFNFKRFIDDALYDMAVTKFAVSKTVWREDKVFDRDVYTAVSPEEFVLIVAGKEEDGYELEYNEAYDKKIPMKNPETGEMSEEMMPVIDAVFTKQDKIEKYAHTYLVAPERFVLARGTSMVDARLTECNFVAEIRRVQVGQLMEEFPDAPMMNDHPKDKDPLEFWAGVHGIDYYDYNEEEVWDARHEYDTEESYQANIYDDRGEFGAGTRQVDVEEVYRKLDIYGTGELVLVRIVKAANTLFAINPVREIPYEMEGLITRAHTPYPLSFHDLIETDDKAVSNLLRILLDHDYQAVQGNYVYDPKKIRQNDMNNRGPGDDIHRTDKWEGPADDPMPLKQGIIDAPTILETSKKIEEQAYNETGVGPNMFGFDNDVKPVNISAQSLQILQNRSNNALDANLRTIIDWLGRIWIREWNLAVENGADHLLVTVRNKQTKIRPEEGELMNNHMPGFDLGENDKANKQILTQTMANDVMALAPMYANMFTPTEVFHVFKNKWEALGATNVDMFMKNPEDVANDPALKKRAEEEAMKAAEQMKLEMEYLRLQNQNMMLKNAEKEQKIDNDDKKADREDAKFELDVEKHEWDKQTDTWEAEIEMTQGRGAEI